MNKTQPLARAIVPSAIGPLYLSASDRGLTEVFIRKPKDFKELFGQSAAADEIIAQATRELDEYFSGKREVFSVAIDAGGTKFQQRVWEQLRLIPYGKTLSYSDIARKLNQEKAVRAVGTANGRNPISIIVPCHRVIAAGGGLGGYSGGLEVKSKLLQLEKAILF